LNSAVDAFADTELIADTLAAAIDLPRTFRRTHPKVPSFLVRIVPNGPTLPGEMQLSATNGGLSLEAVMRDSERWLHQV
jgi:hypothetical protein